MTAYQAAADERNFGEDAKFLAAHVETIVLENSPDGPRVAIVPAYQGRVMTSSATGNGGTSYGWINYGLIESGKEQPQIHVFGGEERFWLVPEGGQFSIFFDRGATFDFAEWRTPPVIDTEPFAVVEKSSQSASFRREAALTNYSGTDFQGSETLGNLFFGAQNLINVSGGINYNAATSISGTDDDYLWQQARVGIGTEIKLDIPVPNPGLYRVTFFATTIPTYAPNQTITLENGLVVIEEMLPVEGEIEEVQVTVQVDDGMLNVVVSPNNSFGAWLSAIRIEELK